MLARRSVTYRWAAGVFDDEARGERFARRSGVRGGGGDADEGGGAENAHGGGGAGVIVSGIA